ncbi:WD repeat-containing protein 74 [Stigmatopora nigra]
MGDISRPCTVWLGSETGILKGVSLSRKKAHNFCHSSQMNRQHEVRTLCWGDPAESEVLVAAQDGTVKTFSLEKGIFTDVRQCADPDDGSVVGLATLDDGAGLVTCAGEGMLKVWKDESGEPAAKIRVGNNIARMRQNPEHRNKVATGGKENCLKVWDLEKPDVPVFAAKNLPDDWLSLRQPTWVMDMAFIPGSDKVVTCTGYHQVHVYDPSTSNRRPVMEAIYGEYPLTTLSLPATGGSVVVGNTHGQIAVLDLRKGLVRGCFKGMSGGVRSLQCHASQPLVASCGLDRFLRIHNLGDRQLKHKVYLKSRLTCLLLASRPLDDPEDASGDDCVEVKEEDDDVDEVWDAMERVGERGENPKRKVPAEEGENPGKKTSEEPENSESGTLEEGEKSVDETGEDQDDKTPEVEEEEPPKKQKRKKAEP